MALGGIYEEAGFSTKEGISTPQYKILIKAMCRYLTPFQKTQAQWLYDDYFWLCDPQKYFSYFQCICLVTWRLYWSFRSILKHSNTKCSVPVGGIAVCSSQLSSLPPTASQAVTPGVPVGSLQQGWLSTAPQECRFQHLHSQGAAEGDTDSPEAKWSRRLTNTHSELCWPWAGTSPCSPACPINPAVLASTLLAKVYYVLWIFFSKIVMVS